jgi:hypothetical protein
MHRAGLGLPASPRPCRGTYDEATGLGLKLNLFRKTGFVEEWLGHADAPRVADADDTGLRGHVITV